MNVSSWHQIPYSTLCSNLGKLASKRASNLSLPCLSLEMMAKKKAFGIWKFGDLKTLGFGTCCHETQFFFWKEKKEKKKKKIHVSLWKKPKLCEIRYNTHAMPWIMNRTSDPGFVVLLEGWDEKSFFCFCCGGDLGHDADAYTYRSLILPPRPRSRSRSGSRSNSPRFVPFLNE